MYLFEVNLSWVIFYTNCTLHYQFQYMHFVQFLWHTTLFLVVQLNTGKLLNRYCGGLDGNK